MTYSEQRIFGMLQNHPGAWLWVGTNKALRGLVTRMRNRGLLAYTDSSKQYVRLV